ncbi:MAG: hypothetical protein J6S69_05775, partial [Proteobacteria bacterium]|nr:hypothetical protein [Pseudomonadota bacterium]
MDDMQQDRREQIEEQTNEVQDMAEFESSEALNENASEEDDESEEAMRSFYTQLTSRELNSAYLNAWRELVLMMCAHYARRFPERCQVTAQETDDMPISSTHLARALYDDDMFFSETQLMLENGFFDRRGIPTHEAIMTFLAQNSEMLARIRRAAKEAGHELAIDRIRKTFALNYKELELLMIVALAAMDDSVYRAMAFAAGTVVSKKFRASFVCELNSLTRGEVQKNMEL